MGKLKAKYAFWHTAAIANGDFSATGTALGALADGSDDIEVQIETDSTALGNASSGATVDGRIRTLDKTAVSTMVTADGAMTEGFLFITSESGDSYSQFGPLICNEAKELGPTYGGSRRTGAMFGFSGRASDVADIYSHITASVTLP